MAPTMATGPVRPRSDGWRASEGVGGVGGGELGASVRVLECRDSLAGRNGVLLDVLKRYQFPLLHQG